MFTAAAGHLAVVQMLLSNGSGVKRRTDDGRTAIMVAASKGHNDVVQLLKSAGARE